MSTLSHKQSTGLPVVGLVVWGTTVYGVLQIHRLPLFQAHSICSPAWGCGPPTNALVSYHGFWLVLFYGPVLLFYRTLLCHSMPPQRLKLFGGALSGLGVLGLAGIVAWEAYYWLPLASDFQREYFVQRCLFRVAVLVDFPVVQTLLTGLTLLVIARIGCARQIGQDPHRQQTAESVVQEQKSLS